VRRGCQPDALASLCCAIALYGLFVLVRLPTGFMCTVWLAGLLVYYCLRGLMRYLFELLVWELMIDLCGLGCCLFGLYCACATSEIFWFIFPCCAGMGLIGAYLSFAAPPLSCLLCWLRVASLVTWLLPWPSDWLTLTCCFDLAVVICCVMLVTDTSLVTGIPSLIWYYLRKKTVEAWWLGDLWISRCLSVCLFWPCCICWMGVPVVCCLPKLFSFSLWAGLVVV
jgi:hypothetical protein